MTKWHIAILAVIIAGAILSGCDSEPQPLTEPVKLDPATAKPSYWLNMPAAASVFCDDYDKLWVVCGDVARDELFTLDREDYRDGLLTTHPMISRQFFEFWRPDTGDTYGVVQNSLQSVRRSIEFHFDKLPGGYTVSPKVLIERLARENQRVSVSAQYQEVFNSQIYTSADRQAGAKAPDSASTWYATGRDLAMEAELAKIIQQRLGPQ
jgi:hypothetical protein